MNCSGFVQLMNEWNMNNRVCLFGTGRYGKVWGYELIKSAGFNVAFYVDNNTYEEECNGLPVYSPEYLKKIDFPILCFVTVVGDSGKEITEQLKSMDVKNVFWLHENGDFLNCFPQYLDELGNKELINKFNFLMDDNSYLSLIFEEKMGYKPDLEHPQTYNEKLQWLKLFDRKEKYTKMVDKYEAKHYASEIIGKQYIIPTLGVYDSFDNIDFNDLPDKFVLKCTHDSGGVVICRDKADFDINKAKQKISSSLNRNYYWIGREWPYKYIRPRIIAEKYMEDYETKELRDYKFFTFDGEAKVLFIASERQLDGEETKFDFFNMNFCHLPIRNGHPNADNIIKKPVNFEEMIMLAEKLSSDIPHLRVDFYEVNGKTYFGEMTFYHWSGFVPFEPCEWDEKFGEWINIPYDNQEKELIK